MGCLGKNTSILLIASSLINCGLATNTTALRGTGKFAAPSDSNVGMGWRCDLCIAFNYGGYVVALPLCLSLCALENIAKSPEMCEPTCNEMINGITAVGGFCASNNCPICHKNSACNYDQWCCGAIDLTTCVPGTCQPKRANGDWCNEDAACQSGHCNAFWDAGKTSTCDEKRNCDGNDECDQATAFCCGFGDSISHGSCTFRTCTHKKRNKESCGEDAECYSGHCCAILEGCDVGWGHCKDLDTDCVVTQWSPWSLCSASCGGGSQTRGRLITKPQQKGGKSCPALEETQPCNEEACPTTTTTTTTRCPMIPPYPPDSPDSACESDADCGGGSALPGIACDVQTGHCVGVPQVANANVSVQPPLTANPYRCAAVQHANREMQAVGMGKCSHARCRPLFCPRQQPELLGQYDQQGRKKSWRTQGYNDVMDGLSKCATSTINTEQRDFPVPPVPGGPRGVLSLPQCVEKFEYQSTGTDGRERMYTATCTRDSAFCPAPARKYPFLRDENFIGECHCTLEGFEDTYSDKLDFRWKRWR